MNNIVIAGAHGVNRIEAFLNSQRAAGLHEANPAELQAVEGGVAPIWTLAWVGLGAIPGAQLYVLYSLSY
jgi:hypothetical protein